MKKRCCPNNKTKNISGTNTASLNIKIDDFSKNQNNKEINDVLSEFDSDLEVSDKKVLDSKVVFGKLMVETRVSGEVVLTSILGNITNTSCDTRYLYLYTTDESIFKALSKQDNINILNNNLSKFTYLTVMPKLQEQKEKIDIEKIIAEKFKGYYTK